MRDQCVSVMVDVYQGMSHLFIELFTSVFVTRQLYPSKENITCSSGERKYKYSYGHTDTKPDIKY